MAAIIRSRTIRPSTRAETSKNYRVSCSGLSSTDTLVVNINHEVKLFEKQFIFNGFDLTDRKSISFRVNETDSSIEIVWANIRPIEEKSIIEFEPKIFNSPSNSEINDLTVHDHIEHDKAEGQIINCLKCRKKVELLHELVNEPILVCPYCNKEFDNYILKQKEAEKAKGCKRVITYPLILFSIIYLSTILFKSNILTDITRQDIEKYKPFNTPCIGWDNRCLCVEKYIKANLNDEDSYEHVKTEYFKGKGCIIVICKYRAKNVFGAKILNIIKAEVSYNCEFIRELDIYTDNY